MDETSSAEPHSHADADTQDHAHDHHAPEDASVRTLAVVAGLNLLGFVAELTGGILFGSVALVSDAVHMLFDALAYVMALAAAYVATHHDSSANWSYGLHRLEPLSAFLNGALLLPMVGYIVYESIQRFLHPVSIGTGPTLAIAVGGLAVNLVSVYVLEGGEMSLNEKGAFYHLLGDAGGSVAVIVSVLAIRYTGLRILDPLTAGLIAVVIIWSAGRLLHGSGAIFLHRSPVDVPTVESNLAAIDGVVTVADSHVWQLCSQLTIATVHLETNVESLDEAEAVRRQAHSVLADHDVGHATVELCAAYDERATHLDAHAH